MASLEVAPQPRRLHVRPNGIASAGSSESDSSDCGTGLGAFVVWGVCAADGLGASLAVGGASTSLIEGGSALVIAGGFTSVASVAE